MRFLVDPATVALNLWAWAYVIILTIVLPALAVSQHQSMERGELALPPRRQIYASTLVTHAVLAALAGGITWSRDFDFFGAGRLDATSVAAGAVALALGLPLLSGRFEATNPATRERVRHVAPRSPADLATFYLMSLTAAFSEQLAYRGVLFVLLSAVTASWLAAALIAAAAFGAAHVFQGWRSAGIVALVGLRDQIVVGLTGTLAVAMIIHALHDIIAGTVMRSRARLLEQEGATVGLS